MFILHSSNKTENLLEHLCAIISNSPLADPLAKEVFLIQSQGMERWLSQQLARKFQLFANSEFLFPGKFFSQMARHINQQIQTDIFARELMVWRIENLLRDLDAPVFSELKQYISGENIDLKRFQLATHLAQIFDQYQVMRPMLLNDWQQGKLHYFSATEKWQQALWLKLSLLTTEQHRGALWLQAIAKFNGLPPGKLGTELPERISIFGLNTMPPLFMEFIQGLARHTDVHFYLLNPAQAFWADMVSSKRVNLEAFENGHPLLASLGQQGREFQQMLLDRAFELELDSFEDNPGESLSNLQQLQNDMLNNASSSLPMVSDGSISIHSCHTRMREVEVLKAQLLHALETDPKLELRDIVVMAPDIQQYAPFISGVFDELQHAIADRSLRNSNSTFDTFLRFIRLTQSRFGWQQVMDLLSQAEVYRCFGLTETDVELIQHWVAGTYIRWGKSATHKQQLNLPKTAENTWQAGLERLLMGYAVGTEDDFFAGILPYSEIEGSSAQALGGLHDFLQLLFSASSKLAKSYTLAEWAAHLLAYADLLFPAEQLDDAAQQAEKQQMNEIFLELSQQFAAIHDQPVSLSVILAWLEGRVEEVKSSNGFLRGQLTFCSMLPMRSIPFKVIALLGMNEGEFPHIDHHLTFDLLGKDFQPGDRSRRADDRYQFLEILLSARQQVIITYIGQSISENEPIPASVVIHELLDVMQEHYQLDSLITQHPLQSFSPRYFKSETGLISYSHTDFATAQALSAHKTEQQAWWQGEIQADNQAVIEVQELLRFYRHPQKYFLQQQLNIRLHGIEADEQEHEPFSLEGMDSYLLNHQWIEAKLKQDNLSLAKLKAQGRWISGELGVLAFNAQEQEIDKFVEKILSKSAGLSSDPIAIDINIDAIRLVGTIANQYTEASLIYRYTPMKGKDFIIAWLQHLILNRHGTHTTHLISLDEYITFLPEHIKGNELEQFLQLYLQGQSRPGAFFTEAAFSYIKQQSALNTPSSRSSVPAIVKAQEVLSHAIEQSYEPELQLLYKNLGGIEELLNSEFEQYCNDLLLPVWEASG
ncbi:exodeoxyribonuclease V gamma subunit [Bathymodiolus japonicus methanotrophic gill symbiont]|uniref:exodeoxyribonuclease V subunit gamma n=1 Tax=Bathymodiolus japonicus methanotrophic gill symbiont TaxID=113269 RepID=UPI001B4C558F|nr:exodeoxyribonuclease V subunit gamma [Bathymodiolus japonicus methanotrophic gill symbiont]GFO71870.1 exodeoxyribonuclease V gamma subunit [Bathymodiolus japonicus methanotrophic gill symbiont]